MDSLELQDWEVLAHSDVDAVGSPVSTDNPRHLEEIEADSGGMIRLDYFSLANDSMSDKAAVIASSDVESSVGSNNPSWIDPATDVRYESRNPFGFWSDSGSDRSDGRKASDLGPRTEFVGAEETEAEDVEFDLVKDEFSSCQRTTEVGFEEMVKTQLGFEEIEENKTNDCSECHGTDSLEDNSSIIEAAVDLKPNVEEVKKQVVWWKVPFELLRFCVFRVSPVWTFSMAAAVMGFVVLGRRLYNMKRKAKSLELQVTVDDKKVSQFMRRAARLNEAFSVVRRVPIVRPMLPAAGSVNPWPVMNMR